MDSSRPRLVWPDLAKGLCILLVVLHHTTAKYYPLVAPDALAPLVEGWVALTYALKPVRMPLFFVLSGFFAASALDRPWPAAVRRIVTSGYLYLVWLVLLFAFFAVERTLAMNRTQDLRELVLDLLWPSTGLWFLWALGAYLLVLRALRRVPAPWVLGAGAALAVATAWLPVDEANRISVVFHFVFFAVGALRPALVRRLADAPVPLLTGTAVYVGLTVALQGAGLPASVELLALSALGVPLGLALAVRLARVSWVAAPVAWVGRRTLPVYVLHMPVLALLLHLPIGLGGGLGPGSVALVATYPVLATVLVVGGCLLAEPVLRRLGAPWLFALPAPLGERLRNVAATEAPARSDRRSVGR